MSFELVGDTIFSDKPIAAVFNIHVFFTRFIVHVFQHFQLAMMKPDFPEMFEMRVSTKKPVFVCRQHIVIVACISIDNAPIVVHGMRHDLQMNIPL